MDPNRNKPVNEHELEALIDKLLNPVSEIRWRALHNILSKLNYGLLDIENLIEIQQGKLCHNLVNWFSCDIHSIEDPKIVLKFLLKIIKETKNGLSIIINCNTRNILQNWASRYTEDYETILLIRDVCSELITTIELDNSISRERLNYGGKDDDLKELEDTDPTSTTENSLATTTNSIASPAGYILRTRQDHIRSKLPDHLLGRDASPPEQSTTSNTVQDENRMYSPISRSYLQRKVRFSTNSESQELENGNTDIIESDIIIDIFPKSKLLSEWHTLSKVDRDLLSDITSRIKSSERYEAQNAMQEFSSLVLEDYPTEIFLQRPSIVFSVFDLLRTHKDAGRRYSSLYCLEKMAKKLQERLKFCANVGFVGKKNCDTLFTDSISITSEANVHGSQGKLIYTETFVQHINLVTRTQSILPDV